MPVTLPLEVFEAFEKVLGKEEAKTVVRSLETTISELTEYKWKVTKDELLEAMRKDFVTKEFFEERINVLKAELLGIMKQDKAELLGIMQKDKAELVGIIQKDKAELLSIIQQNKAELLGRIDGLYEKTEKDKAELLGIMQKDKAELLSIMQKDKAELVGIIQKDKAELLGIMRQDKVELEGRIELVKAEIKRIDLKLNFLIILMIIALTLMNPVMAEIIKKLLKL